MDPRFPTADGYRCSVIGYSRPEVQGVGRLKYSTRLSDAVHTLVLIALSEGGGLTSNEIAESVQTNPAYIRKFMSQMKREGLITNSRGHPDPQLARPASEITLLDVYRAVEGDRPLLHLDNHINPECGVGKLIQLSLEQSYAEIQAQVDATMAAMTIQDVIDRYRALYGEYAEELGKQGLKLII